LVSELILVTKIGLREAARGYLISLKASNLSPRYFEGMEMVLRQFADYAETQGWAEVSQVAAAHIEKYLVYLQQRPRWFASRDSQKVPMSASSVETHYRRLKTFFHWLVERGHVPKNPLDLIKHPRFEERVIPTVREQDMLNLLKLVDPRHARTPAEKFRAFRNRAIIWLLIDTPIRREELGTLQVDDVDLDASLVKVMGKGRRERWMPLGETSLLALWDYMQVRNSRLPNLWLDEHGRPLECQAVYQFLKRLGKRAGVPNLHTHRFRHTFATSYLRNGGSERYLRLIGGWRRIPETYFRTLDTEDVARAHQQLSPGDRLAGQLRGNSHPRWKQNSPQKLVEFKKKL
jgi:site-specific recombinase XerD